MVLRQAILNQWSVPAITTDPLTNRYDINDDVSTFIVENMGSKFKVTIKRLEDV